MSTEPLTPTLDARKAAVRGAVVNGVLGPSDLPRFRALLASDQGTIKVELSFSRDEENRYVVEVDVAADVVVVCQRCLQEMQENVISGSAFAVVWTEEQALHLPRHLDPLVVDGNICNLWELVEDELMLSLRPFPKHDSDTCYTIDREFSDAEVVLKAADEPPNPFNVLAQLKPGAKQ